MSSPTSLSGSPTPSAPQPESTHFPLTALFPDLQTFVFSHLKPADVASMGRTCKAFNQMVKGDHQLTLLFNNRFSSALQIENIQGFPCLYACKKQHRVQQNFDNGIYHLSTLSEDKEPICTHTFYGKRLITGSEEGTIKIWDIEEKKCLKTLEGHEGGISCLTTIGDTLISGSSDGEIKVWDLNSGERQKTLTGHEEGIQFLDVVGKELISCCSNGVVLFWNVNTWEKVDTLQLDKFSGAVVVNQDVLITAQENRSIVLWDLQTREEIRHFEGLEVDIMILANAGSKFVSGCEDGTIQIWDKQTGECVKKLEGHQSEFKYSDCGVSSLVVAFDRIISGSLDNSIKIWDLESGELLTTLKGHNELVYHADVQGTKLVSCSLDNSIKIWDFEASDKKILEQIAVGFAYASSSYDDKYVDAMNRFSRMPEKVKNGVYECLEQVFEPTGSSGYWTIEKLKEAFHGECRITDSGYRTSAIDKYVETLTDVDTIPEIVTLEDAEEDLPVILPHEYDLLSGLGIFTGEDCVEKLQCSPEFLSKAGIVSLADLEVLNVKCCPLSPLEMPVLATPAPTHRIELQSFCFNKKMDILNCLNDLSENIKTHSENYSIIDPLNENPWKLMGIKVKELQAGIEKSCNTPKGLISLFEHTSHSNLVADVNTLIEEFNALDQIHQTKKISAYISQPGLLGIWHYFHDRGIHTLAELLAENGELPEEYLFRMGS